MADAFVKLYKKMLKWEWYDDTNTKILFIHILLRANWESGSWHGIKYGAGEFITSLQTLADETHLSVMQVRTALNHLISTGEITSRQQGKARIITVNGWSLYQGNNKENNKKATRFQQDDNKVVTTDKEYKEIKESKELKEVKNIYGEYQHVRLTKKEIDRLFNDYGEEETHKAIKFLDEYIQMKGYKAKDHNLALRKWVFKAVKENEVKTEPSRGTSVFDAWANA